MTRRKVYSHIYRVQRVILLAFYTVTAVAVAILLAWLMSLLVPDSLFVWAATLVLYMVGVVYLGSLISMISYIPFNLATAFDPIKNEVAGGKITDTETFIKRVTSFTAGFFNFSFLDISGAFMVTAPTGMVSHKEMPGIEAAMEKFDMENKSRQLEEVTRAGTIELGQKEYHLYILPIWFDGEWLGYMGLLTERRIGRFYQKVLMEFENNYLDDLLMILLRSSSYST